jgi:2-amino-4-hydroxy-6-hydroxymethyldihydropteridine diphosphokinase
MARAFLGIGANVGNRRRNLQLALRWLAPACRVISVSSLYRSDAVVLEGSPPGPDYLNAVCEVDTQLSPLDLLDHVKSIERSIGRRPAERWAPRPIDIDILLYNNDVIESDRLTVPHPGIVERNFVLVPLAELAPHIEHPREHRTIGDLAATCDHTGLELLSTSAEWFPLDAATD